MRGYLQSFDLWRGGLIDQGLHPWHFLLRQHDELLAAALASHGMSLKQGSQTLNQLLLGARHTNAPTLTFILKLPHRHLLQVWLQGRQVEHWNNAHIRLLDTNWTLKLPPDHGVTGKRISGLR